MTAYQWLYKAFDWAMGITLCGWVATWAIGTIGESAVLAYKRIRNAWNEKHD